MAALGQFAGGVEVQLARPKVGLCLADGGGAGIDIEAAQHVAGFHFTAFHDRGFSHTAAGFGAHQDFPESFGPATQGQAGSPGLGGDRAGHDLEQAIVTGVGGFMRIGLSGLQQRAHDKEEGDCNQDGQSGDIGLVQGHGRLKRLDSGRANGSLNVQSTDTLDNPQRVAWRGFSSRYPDGPPDPFRRVMRIARRTIPMTRPIGSCIRQASLSRQQLLQQKTGRAG